ncbi:hypothetical protein CEK25_013671 [Fusarium fujikuroi]|nr:hypothetical protein CEK25_013671 [Fusarium fujikuroi]
MPAEPTPTRVRRRATEACTFCRKRKVRPTTPPLPQFPSHTWSEIKCNGQKPKCINCQTYEKDCVYEPVPDVTKAAGRQRHQRTKTRSVKARTESPARQTSAPAASSNGDSSEAASSSQQAVTTRDGAQPRHQSWDPSPRPMDSGVARVVVLANGESTYHGRTSALFEDNAQERPVEQEVQPRMPDHWVERGLIAEAAKQRQLEEIHFAKGQLDFDGVDPDLGMHLLSLHWNRQHHSFLITYRPAFMRDMACGGPYFSKLLLNAIYFGSSKFSPRLEVRKDVNDVRTAGWRYRERVRELVGGSLDRSDITTIQALLVMTNSLFALGDERSAAWLYAGLAFRMLIDLGLHVDLTNSHQFSDEDLEIRRRVFWGAFVVDKIQSLYQGRPVTLKENDAMVPIKFIDTYSELEFWQPFAYSTSRNDYAGSPAYSISTFTALCKLSIVMSDVMSTIYTVRTTDQSPAELSKVLDKLQKKLRDWHTALPDHLKPEVANAPDATVPPPHVLSLHAMYHVLVILLHRPFVADGHLYNTFRSISVDSVIKCSAAASSICSLLRAYHRAFSVRRAPYLISYATYVAATIHCRIAAKNGKGSAAYVNLMTCLSRLNRRIGYEGLENTGSAQTETSPNQEMQPVELSGSAVPSPGSDWINIDGIIQSFLREGDFNAGSEPTMYSQYPQKIPQVDGEHYLHTSTGQQPVYFPQGFPAGGLNSFPTPVPGAGDIEGGNSWQQTSFWPANQDAAFLEDPIFGFNGSSTDLPEKESEWGPHLISALGSRNNDAKQVDGVGGGSSTTSKVAVISLSSREDADVDFTFVQVAVGKESVDFSGNCGNMSSGVGPFAVQERLVTPKPGQTEIDVRIFNTNTSRIIVETVELDRNGDFKEDGDFIIPGVKSPGSEVKCSFVDPAGSMAGSLFPSGQKQQWLHVDPSSLLPEMAPFQIRATLIDAANPFVMISAADFTGILGANAVPETQHALVEAIRCQGAVDMGLATSTKVAGLTRGTPKIALLSSPTRRANNKTPDIYVQSYSMGLPHPTLQLTGAVCLGSAVSIQGTIAADLSATPITDGPPTPERTPSPDMQGERKDTANTRQIIIEHTICDFHPPDPSKSFPTA